MLGLDGCLGPHSEVSSGNHEARKHLSVGSRVHLKCPTAFTLAVNLAIESDEAENQYKRLESLGHFTVSY